MFDTALYVSTVCTGALLQSLCGFGAGVFVMSVLPHFFESYSFSLVVSSLSALAGCVLMVSKERKHINARMIMPVIIGNATAMTLVMLYWSGDASDLMKKILGVFLVCLSLYFIFLNSNIKIKATFRSGLISGLLGGVSNSLFSMGGPPVVMYAIAAAKDNKEYHASLQLYFCFSSTYATILRYMRGMVTDDVWPMYLAGLPFIALGTWIGMRMFGALNAEKLRFIIYVFMALSGAVLIFT